MAYLDRNDLIRRIDSIDKKTASKILDYASVAAGLNCLSKGCEPPTSEEVGRVGNDVVLE